MEMKDYLPQTAGHPFLMQLSDGTPPDIHWNFVVIKSSDRAPPLEMGSIPEFLI